MADLATVFSADASTPTTSKRRARSAAPSLDSVLDSMQITVGDLIVQARRLAELAAEADSPQLRHHASVTTNTLRRASTVVDRVEAALATRKRAAKRTSTRMLTVDGLIAALCKQIGESIPTLVLPSDEDALYTVVGGSIRNLVRSIVPATRVHCPTTTLICISAEAAEGAVTLQILLDSGRMSAADLGRLVSALPSDDVEAATSVSMHQGRTIFQRGRVTVASDDDGIELRVAVHRDVDVWV